MYSSIHPERAPAARQAKHGVEELKGDALARSQVGRDKKYDGARSPARAHAGKAEQLVRHHVRSFSVNSAKSDLLCGCDVERVRAWPAATMQCGSSGFRSESMLRPTSGLIADMASI